MPKPTLTAVLVPSSLIALFGGSLALILVVRTNPHVRRAEKLLAEEDYEGAQSELHTAMAQGVTDPHAKALLLFTILERGDQDGRGDTDAPPTPAAQDGTPAPTSAPVALAFTPFTDDSVPRMLEEAGRLRFAANPAWPAGTSNEAEHALVKGVADLRRDLEDRGIPTTGPGELYRIETALARYVFTRRAPRPGAEGQDDDDSAVAERYAAAYALADAGDERALQTLVSGLSGRHADLADGYLVKLGPNVEPALDRVIEDKNAMARDRAMAILSKALVGKVASEIFQLEPKARACTLDDLPEKLRTAENRQRLADRFSSDSSRLFQAAQVDLELPVQPDLGSLYLSLGTPDDGLLALYGCDPDKDEGFTYLYHFDGERYRPVKIQRDGRIEAYIAGAAPVLKLAEAGVNVELWQPAVVSKDVEKQVPLAGKPKVGDRVWLSSIAIAGTIASSGVAPPDDSGGGGEPTYTINLDSPYDGNPTFYNASEYDLVGLKKEKVDAPGDHVIVGALSGDQLAVKPDLARDVDAPTPQTDSAQPPAPAPDEFIGGD